MIGKKWIVTVILMGFNVSLEGDSLNGAELKAATVHAWTNYVNVTEARIAAELNSSPRFFARDFLTQTEASAERQTLLQGKVVVRKMETRDTAGAKIDMPGGMIHHWRGSILVPGVHLGLVMGRVENPASEELHQEDVLASRILSRSQDGYKLYLKLQRSKIVTVVYNTEHEVRYGQKSINRAWSTSIAKKIAELSNPNSATEYERPQGQDHGFLWRLNSYWRYGQLPEGVVVECESISLSRGIPVGLEFLVRPLIDRVARESMERTLESMRQRILHPARNMEDGATSGITLPKMSGLLVE